MRNAILLLEYYCQNVQNIGKITNKVSFAQSEDIDLAVFKAREAFNKGYWSNLPPVQLTLKFLVAL